MPMILDDGSPVNAALTMSVIGSTPSGYIQSDNPMNDPSHPMNYGVFIPDQQAVLRANELLKNSENLILSETARFVKMRTVEDYTPTQDTINYAMSDPTLLNMYRNDLIMGPPTFTDPYPYLEPTQRPTYLEIVNEEVIKEDNKYTVDVYMTSKSNKLTDEDKKTIKDNSKFILNLINKNGDFE
jgi:hypothetical protein